jgi:hypothetical protein
MPFGKPVTGKPVTLFGAILIDRRVDEGGPWSRAAGTTTVAPVR